MIKQYLSKEWLFKGPQDSTRISVDLPHDYAISQKRDPKAAGGPHNGFFPGGTGTYVKYLKLKKQHTILNLDGAYMCAEISLNNQLLAIHPHGYTPFLCDLTSWIVPEHDNKLQIVTRGLQPSSRWYSGSGLYRDVFLWTGGEVRIEPWDLFITTPQVSEHRAQVQASMMLTADANVLNEEGKKIQIRISVIDPQGNALMTREEEVTLKQEKTQVEYVLEIENPCLWDLDTPVLYSMRVEILDGESTSEDILDLSEENFGIRSITADAVHGLLLNGRSIKLKGGCIHHDHGVLGAAAFPAAEERKMRKLKEAGFNSVRIAHNPPSTALMEVCDRLGMLVMDEAFDMWNMAKTEADYHLWFRDWWQRDLIAMVKRDRNHPCIISYSIGNEILERDGASEGNLWSRRLSDEVRKYDRTRLVTSGVCGMWGTGAEEIDTPDYKAWIENHNLIDQDESGFDQRTEKYMAPLDIVGYNYLYHRYAKDHELHPDRVIWGSETKVLYFYDSWKAVMENDHVLGDFTWTCYDNIGEVGTGRWAWARDGYIAHINHAPYPWRLCFQGDYDLCGYRRPQSYFRESIWNQNAQPHIFTEHPEHYGEGFSGTDWHWYDVDETWTFDDCYLGKPVKTSVYTMADEVVFELNGREVARAVPEKAIAQAVIPYEPGELIARVIWKTEGCIQTACLKTTGKVSQIVVTAEKGYHLLEKEQVACVPQSYVLADQRDLAYFDISLTDNEGNVISAEQREITCEVENGILMGIYSGDPANEDDYTSNCAHVFHGRALAVVKAVQAGEVKITVKADGLNGGTAEIQAIG